MSRFSRSHGLALAVSQLGTRFAAARRMRARIHSLVLLGFVSLTPLGCSTTATSDAPPVECRGELGEVGQGCPATFDGAPENVPSCTRTGVQQVWTCDDVIALSLGAGAFSVDCYYGSSSHLLVGAMAVNDTNTFCGNSFTRSAGEGPTASCRFPVVMPTFYRSCGPFDSGV